MTNAETIRLRAMEPEDLDMLYTIENDRELWDIGATNVPYSRYVLHDYIANSSGDIYTDREVRLIIETGVGETVGMADITNFDAKNRHAEVGIVIAREQRQKGYALKALEQVVDYAARVVHLRQLYAIINADNDASLQLFRKAGFSDAATLNDWLYDGTSYHAAVVMQIFL